MLLTTEAIKVFNTFVFAQPEDKDNFDEVMKKFDERCLSKKNETYERYSFRSRLHHQGLQHVFVLHGKDLHLDIEKPVTLDEETDLFWRFNSSNYIAKYVFNRDPVVFNKYAGKAEVFEPNCSLKLKKVQHSDSGDYKAVMVGEREQTVAEYKVIVQDQVTPGYLTVDHVTKSSDSCNLTVTCSTVDFNISSSFRCDGKNCSHAGEKDLKATKVFSSLIVYLQQDTIFCNHSNQVSWNQTMKMLRSYCETETGRRRNQVNTIYVVPEEITPGQTPSGHDTYVLVEFDIHPESTKTENIPQPETVYAQVDRAAKSNSTVQQQTPRPEQNQ